MVKFQTEIVPHRSGGCTVPGLWHNNAAGREPAATRHAMGNENPMQTPPPPVTPDSASPTTRRALVVDDHQDSAMALAMMLRSLGFETEVATDGIDALRCATTFQPDLLLLDISMPKLDGIDTSGVIRAQPWARDVRLVAVTGHDPDGFRERSGTAEFDAWLLKPVDLIDLHPIATG